MQQSLKTKLYGALIGVAGTVAAWATLQTNFFHQVDLKMTDLQFLLRGHGPTSRVLLITIDQRSLDQIPELELFWHPYFAKAIGAAADAGAKVMGLDVTFGVPVERWQPGYDQILAEAINRALPAMPVVCGFVPSAMNNQGTQAVPINMIAAAFDLAAYANLTVDPDDFVRRQELLEGPRTDGQPRAHSFALKIVEKYLGAAVEEEPRSGHLRIAGNRIQEFSPRTMLINFAGGSDTFSRVSLVDFVRAVNDGKKKQLEDWVKGKVVLLGPDTIDDRHATPYYLQGRKETLGAGIPDKPSAAGEKVDKRNTAGVEVHANTIETLLDRSFLSPVSAPVEVVLMAATGVAVTAIAMSATPTVAGLLLSVVVALIFFGSNLLFRSEIIAPSLGMILAGLFCWVAAVAYRTLAAERQRALYRNAFSVFVGRKAADSLETRQGFSMEGSQQVMTVMFSDIRGFTAFCESRDPADVVKILNAYLSQMVGIIVKHGGYVNKFIGDGILVTFSADEGGNHAKRAVECGFEMVTAPGQFSTGVGIHSGPVVIGNVGSKEKLEYTVLGDTVNLAARLESLNKQVHSKLLFSQSTLKLAGEMEDVLHLSAVPVRGQSKLIDIYTIGSIYTIGALKSAVISDGPLFDGEAGQSPAIQLPA